MLNTKKLLYLLPDVAYVAELLPAKKEHTFTVQNFRQINGQYMDDNEFLAENVVKLFSKLDQEDYFLVLPDFLFTNTILNVEESSETKVKEYLNDKLLPELDLSEASHQIETFILTEFKGTAKVQLSAIENELLGPIRAAADNSKVKIEGIAPLSWTVKSIISLEPSISVLQIGTQLYTSQHYIGIDQTTITEVSEADAVAETIQTLKGAEPSIQTVYLLVNSVVEEKLKEELSDTIPLQQLADDKDEDSKMPSYVKFIIESGMKTLSIEDYPVPVFELTEATADEKKAFITEQVEDLEAEEAEDEETEETEELPKPTPIVGSVDKVEAGAEAETETDDTESEEKGEEGVEEDKEPEVVEEIETAEDTALPTPLPGAVATVAKGAATVAAAETAVDSEDEEAEAAQEEDKAEEPAPAVITPISADADAKPADTGVEKEAKVEEEEEKAVPETPKANDEIDLSQFTQNAAKVEKSDSTAKDKGEKKKAVIKNSAGIGNMLKMVFITLAVFAATVAIGIGVGFGLLSVANRNNAPEPTPTPTAVSTPQPTSTPEPTPTPAAEEITNADYDIKVVNATTIAGYAGDVKADLDAAEFGTVGASNAAEEYDPGVHVLMEEENPALIAALEEATGLTLVYLEGTDPSQEDPQGAYDAVIVLAE